MRKPIRAVAILIKDNDILLIHRVNQGNEYYVFPGGGVEDSENVEEAVLREIAEETSLNVKIDRLLYHHHLIEENGESDQYFYICKYVDGVPKVSEKSNEFEENKTGKDFYEPLWYPLSRLRETLLYPIEIRDWLLEDLETGFSSQVKNATLKVSDLKQTL